MLDCDFIVVKMCSRRDMFISCWSLKHRAHQVRARDNTSPRILPTNILCSSMVILLKLLQPLKIAPNYLSKNVQRMNLWKIVHSQTISTPRTPVWKTGERVISPTRITVLYKAEKSRKQVCFRYLW